MPNKAALRDARDALGDAETELDKTVQEEPDEDAVAALYHVQRALHHVRALLRRN